MQHAVHMITAAVEEVVYVMSKQRGRYWPLGYAYSYMPRYEHTQTHLSKTPPPLPPVGLWTPA